MAVIGTFYIGLTRQEKVAASIETTTKTLADYANDIATAEGLNLNYYIVSLERNPSFNSLNYPTETLSDIETALGITLVAGDTFISTPFQTNLTKEQKQVQKLAIAAAKRNEDYDINKLPTKYSVNSVVDNVNTGGLIVHRPWAFNYNIVRPGLELFLDPSDTDSYSGTGTTLNDLSSNEYATTIVGSPTFSDYYFNFPDGTSRYIDTNQSLAFETFSIGGWFKTTASGVKMMISKESTAGNPWNYRIWLNGGQINFDMSQVTTQSALSSPLTTYNNGAWYYVMATRDDTSWYLYVNGVQINTKADPYTGSVTNAQELWIGRSAFTSASPSGYQWQGDLGQMFVYDRVLTAAEVLQNYNATRSTYGV